ncbi:hypothetical protein JYT89_02300 [Flavobacteriaceae bacterium AH-315-B10]|nr:hypothetical protein [Flavobacteriaceae bacterium AH-315-B10]
MKKIVPLLLLVFFLGFLTIEAQEDQKIIVQNSYWAKEGKIEEVFKHRLYASQVRDSLGLAVGRVLKRIGTKGELSHVIWECEYPNEAARIEDVRKLTESGAFEKVTKKMGTLIDKFARGIYTIN